MIWQNFQHTIIFGISLGPMRLKFSAYIVLFFLISTNLNHHPSCRSMRNHILRLPLKCSTFDLNAYSLRWYQEIFTDQKWLLSIQNSFIIGIFAALLSTVLGTIAAVGLSSPAMPFKRLITALLLSPMIVPLDYYRSWNVFLLHSIQFGRQLCWT